MKQPSLAGSRSQVPFLAGTYWIVPCCLAMHPCGMPFLAGTYWIVPCCLAMHPCGTIALNRSAVRISLP
jgi:hypothetical protein